jgi:hypothetical protein
LTGIAVGYVIVTYVTSQQTGWFFAYQPPVRCMLEIAAIACRSPPSPVGTRRARPRVSWCATRSNTNEL